MFSVNVRELTISLGSNVIGVRATPNSGSRYFFLLLSSLATLPCSGLLPNTGWEQFLHLFRSKSSNVCKDGHVNNIILRNKNTPCTKFHVILLPSQQWLVLAKHHRFTALVQVPMESWACSAACAGFVQNWWYVPRRAVPGMHDQVGEALHLLLFSSLVAACPVTAVCCGLDCLHWEQSSMKVCAKYCFWRWWGELG